MTTSERVLTGERADLLQAVGMHRGFLRHTVRGLTDAQAATRSTASELCLGGLIKHVTMVEDRWARFMVGGAEAMESEPVDWVGMFQMTDDDTLVDLLARYAETAARTDELITTLDLDASHPLPVAPWFEPGAAWSVRRTLLHVIGETAQHAGHADIIRESIDGAKTMG
ncbi:MULTISPECIES: DinB family protein [unclassified Micromonospora]|uniref:DinB family protein n=1 Tax=unclassified Micromonospora TaxID=2617518 RepID=UPI001C5EC89D|nr:DinB family protein [Micromonospora sp. RL09-050-HVF-A]MBW4705829.1 DinB family protein [Micromonospora sp. RL09-050-HVF-A]